MQNKNHIFYLYALVLVGIVIAFFQLPDNKLHIIACDVGQGDAVLIVYRDIQILTDGGPNNKVTGCLSRYIPFWDRTLELVILTHSDADHATGLIDVMERYNVDVLLTNSIDPGTPTYEVLKKTVGSRGIKVVNPTMGTSMRLGMIYLDILAPEGDRLAVLGAKTDSRMDSVITEKGANEYSIVYELSFGIFKGLFMGDISQKESDTLSTKYGPENTQSVNYIKIPHHGSRNGLTENLLKVIEPKIAVISAGKKNSYGHPHREILEMLKKYSVRVFRTDLDGDVEIITDGKRTWKVD
jgi:competence protein ComEC